MSVIGSNALAGASGQGGGGYVIEKSIRFEGGVDASLTRTPTTAGSSSAFTLSTWVKRSLKTTYEYLMWTTTSFYINFTANDKIDIALYAPDGSSWAVIATSQAMFRDPSAWYHIVVSVDSSAGTTNADRLKLWVNGVETPLTYTTYWGGLITGNIKDVNTTIEHEIGSRSGYDCDLYLADYHWIDGQGLTQNDFGEYDDNNVWRPKEFTGTYGTNGFHLDFADGNDIGNDAAGSNNWTANNLSESGGTVNYVDAISGSPYIPYNAFSTSYISNYVNTSTWAITDAAWAGVWDSSGNTNVFTPPGGIAVSSSLIVYFGNYNNSASTTTLTITYTDSSTETDTFTSGNNNWMGSFTASNASGKTIQSIQVVGPSSATYQSFGGFVVDGQILTSANPGTDVLRDSPTNGDATADTGAGGEVSGNYCTWSPLAGTNVTLSNGNLDCSLSASASSKARSTIAVTSGKYYWEITFKSGNYGMIGISDASLSGIQISYAAGALNYYVQTGTLYGDVGGSFSDTSYGSALSANDVLGVALDMDNGNVKFYKNGSDLGNANTTSLVGKTIMPHLGEAGGATFVTEANFGQRAFAYSAPSGYKALCTANLPDSTIADGSAYFDAVLYSGSGSGSGSQTISGLSFSPDFTWLKSRSSTLHHRLFDTVQGPSSALSSNLNGSSDDLSSIFSFTNDGFTVTDDSNVAYNRSGTTYVGWNWDAGSSTASNTDGDVTSSVRANQTAGFSIVKWTAPTWNGGPQSVGHGLNAAPSFIAAKVINDSGSWYCYHKSLDASNPEDKYISLNDSSAAGTLADSWGTSAPSSTTFGDRLLGWAGGKDVIAYCMSPVAGYSAFGSYIGNGSSTDGTFVFTNFRPSLIVVKRAYGTGNWHAFDTTRDADNRAENGIYWNLSSAETVVYFADINSNGFKLRTSNAELNGNGDTYIYLAFAEHPFQANGGLAR